MILPLLLLIVDVVAGSAWAGVPVALPPGESEAAWLDPLALHALEIGAAEAGARVTLRAAGGTWTATVIRGSGEVIELKALAPPADEREREALASRLASTLRPIAFTLTPAPEEPAVAAEPDVSAATVSTVSTVDTATTTAVADAAVAVAPEATTDPDGADAGGSDTEDPDDSAEPDGSAELDAPDDADVIEFIDLDSVDPASRAVDLWLRASGGASLRPFTDPGGAAQLLVGVAGPRWRAGIGGGLSGRSDLGASDVIRELSGAAVRAGGVWSPFAAERRGFDLGVAAELSRRSFYEDGALIDRLWVPALAPELDLWLVPIAPVGVGIFSRAWVDLRRGQLQVGAANPADFSPLALEVGLLLDWR